MHHVIIPSYLLWRVSWLLVILTFTEQGEASRLYRTHEVNIHTVSLIRHLNHDVHSMRHSLPTSRLRKSGLFKISLWKLNEICYWKGPCSSNRIENNTYAWYTVFTRINAAALIKFFAPQMRRLIEGGAHLKTGRIKEIFPVRF